MLVSCYTSAVMVMRLILPQPPHNLLLWSDCRWPNSTNNVKLCVYGTLLLIAAAQPNWVTDAHPFLFTRVFLLQGGWFTSKGYIFFCFITAGNSDSFCRFSWIPKVIDSIYVVIHIFPFFIASGRMIKNWFNKISCELQWIVLINKSSFIHSFKGI